MNTKFSAYGVQGSDGKWLEWMTLSRADAATCGWTEHPLVGYRGTEREAKAVAMLVPLHENHPLRVRPLHTEVRPSS